MPGKIIKDDNKTYLIKLDIDGTSTNPDFATLNPKLKKVLEKLIEKGNIICFTTGRNRRSALPFYQEVGLNTFLVTYNGAYIDNPSDEKKGIVVINPIRNVIVRSILNEPIIKKSNLYNVLIDKADEELTTISTSNDDYYREIFFNSHPDYTMGKDILQLLGEDDALQLVLEFPNSEAQFNEILATLHNEYGNAITFYCSDKQRPKSLETKF